MSAKDKGDKTAEDIIKAAIQCVATIGLERTSMAKIGDLLGISRSLIAYHFPKQRDLFYQITEYIVNDLTKFLEEQPNKPDNTEELFASVEKYFSMNHDQLVSFLNFFYYCSLEYRYHGQYKELMTYFKTYSKEDETIFMNKVDFLVGKLVRMAMDVKYKKRAA